jgi:hypothetical protein
MQVIGIIISSYKGAHPLYSAGAYDLAFSICLLGIVASLIFYAFSKVQTEVAAKGGKGQKTMALPTCPEG